MAVEFKVGIRLPGEKDGKVICPSGDMMSSWRRTPRKEFGNSSKSRREFLIGLGIGDPCFRGQFVWVI